MINNNDSREPNLLDLINDWLADYQHIAPHIKERLDEEEKQRKLKELIDWFVYLARSIVENSGSESQAIQRSGNITVNFVREYNSINK